MADNKKEILLQFIMNSMGRTVFENTADLSKTLRELADALDEKSNKQ
jgi:hypothetical protein